MTMIIAAIGVWYGGWVDELIQRITEVNLVLPFLSILIMIGTFYIAQHLGDPGRDDPLEHFWRVASKATGRSSCRSRSAVHRGSARLRRQQRAHHLPLPAAAHHPDADPGPGDRPSRLTFSWKPRWRCSGWATRCCPPGARSSTMPARMAPCTRGCITGSWNRPCCLMLTGLAFALLGFALDRIFNPRLRGV